jgi:hypothetical protein
MTIETQTRDLLLRAADEIDVEPPPVEALLGSASRRRRRIAAAVAGVSAAAVVVAVAIVGTGGDSTRAPMTSVPPTTAPGTRLVGMNGVMVSVPQDWATDRVKCGTAMADTVFFDSGEYRLCRVTPVPRVSVLSISDVGENGSAFQLAQEARQPTRVDGVEAFRRPTYHYAPPCPDATSCGDRYIGTLYVPSLGVVFSVSSPSRGVVDPILDSAHLIPHGYQAIPAFASLPDARAFGFDVSSQAEYAPSRSENSILSVDPPIGSVVPDGAAIRVTVATGIDSPGDCCVASEVLEVSRPDVECGPTGGAMVTALASRDPFEETVVLDLVSDGHIVGHSAPTTLRSAVTTRLSAAVTGPVADGSVDLYVRLAKPLDPESYLARVLNLPLRLPPGTVCY